jgi:hypothetical protein
MKRLELKYEDNTENILNILKLCSENKHDRPSLSYVIEALENNISANVRHCVLNCVLSENENHCVLKGMEPLYYYILCLKSKKNKTNLMKKHEFTEIVNAIESNITINTNFFPNESSVRCILLFNNTIESIVTSIKNSIKEINKNKKDYWKFQFQYHYRNDTEYGDVYFRDKDYYYIRFGNYHLCAFTDERQCNRNSIELINSVYSIYGNSINDKLIETIKCHSNDSELMNELKLIINDKNSIILMVPNDSAILYQKKCSIIPQLTLEISFQFSCKVNDKILCILKYQFSHPNPNIIQYINEWPKEKIIKKSSNILIYEIEPQLSFDILWNFNYSNHSLQNYINYKKNARKTEMLDSLLKLITKDGTYDQIIGIRHLSSLKFEMNEHAIQILLKIIDERLSRNICDETMIMTFNVMENTNYDLLLNSGMNRFVSCLKQFSNNNRLIESIFSLYREICNKSIDSLMKYADIFADYLNEPFDSIVLHSAEILSLIINFGEISEEKNRLMIKLNDAISKWNLNANAMVNLTSLKSFHHFLNSNYDIIQYFSIWTLTYLTRFNCQLYCLMVEMEILKKMIENRETKIYVLNLAKLLHFQCETFNEYGHLNGIDMSSDIEIFKYFNNRQSFIHYNLITDHWQNFKKLTYEFLSKIRYGCIYYGNEAILVNNEDHTFIIKNKDIKEIPILCKKGICDFSFHYYLSGYYGEVILNKRCHVIALSKNGEIFGYGNNEYKQIMNCEEKFIENAIKISLDDKVKLIACGDSHTMVTTDNNYIVMWGKNRVGQCGNGTNEEIAELPFKVKINENSDIKSIVCGAEHSLVLYGNGIVYGWGYNHFGQLGLGTNLNQLKPIKILENIKQIVCGSGHTLALNYDGIVYAMGLNRYGQLGSGDTNDEKIPKKIEMKFKEIAAYGHTSMGIDLSGECYIWGKFSKNSVLKPKKDEYYKSLNEILVLYL